VGVAGAGRGAREGAAGWRGDGSESHGQGQKGAKRSLLTEAEGVPLGIAPAGANLNDFKLARATIESIPVERPEPTPERPQGLCLDRGYDYGEVRELAREFGFTAHIRSRGEEAQALKREAGFRARRWVVERTHSWLQRFRRILVRWENQAFDRRSLTGGLAAPPVAG
jgi:putative transposase